LKTILFPKIFQPFLCKELIRLGKNNDGGYIVNQIDVLNATQLLSFGIGEDITFETDFYKMNPCSILSFDSNDNTKIHSNFFTDNKKHIRKNLNDGVMIDDIDFGEKTFIKCDIDGEEYSILSNIIQRTKKIIGMVFEFHDVHLHKNFNDVTNFISKIDQKLIHVHINNYTYLKTENGIIPTVIELSFSSSNNLEYTDTITLPNVLDMPNNPLEEDFEIIYK